MEVKRMDIREFVDQGYLQELNRLFLHPLGLAIEVVKEEDGSMHLGGVWDSRDDPEGIIFCDEIISSPKVIEKTVNITSERQKRYKDRRKYVGNVVLKGIQLLKTEPIRPKEPEILRIPESQQPPRYK